MFQIDVEMLELARRFNEAHVEYALCGALALAMHGHPRGTRDIDFIIPMKSMFEARRIVQDAGFTFGPKDPITFAQGAVHVVRQSKPIPGGEDFLTVDLMTYREDHSARIETQTVTVRGVRLSMVTRDSLIYLKSLSERPRDHDDIQRLQSGDVEDVAE